MSETNEALELWRRWWAETDGDPWVADWTDHGYPSTCFFCSSSLGEHHDDDCIYVLVAKLLGKDIYK